MKNPYLLALKWTEAIIQSLMTSAPFVTMANLSLFCWVERLFRIEIEYCIDSILTIN